MVTVTSEAEHASGQEALDRSNSEHSLRWTRAVRCYVPRNDSARCINATMPRRTIACRCWPFTSVPCERSTSALDAGLSKNGQTIVDLKFKYLINDTFYLRIRRPDAVNIATDLGAPARCSRRWPGSRRCSPSPSTWNGDSSINDAFKEGEGAGRTRTAGGKTWPGASS